MKYPHLHKQHFDALVRRFEELGLTIDRACGDVCRLRCQSYDIHQYIHLNAKPFSGIYRPPKPSFHILPSMPADNQTEEKVAELCNQIAQCSLDLTATYDDWIKLGASLSTLVEPGRQYFHLCSSQNPNYNPAECDRKFTNLLRTNRRITIATFFYLCRNAGIM